LTEQSPGITARETAAPAETPALAYAGLLGQLGRAEMTAFVDADCAGPVLSVRAWRAGDRFRPLGMHQEKKVQDFFADAKVPRGLRMRVPLVFGVEHLVWLAGLRIDDRVRLTPASRRVLALQLEPLATSGTQQHGCGSSASPPTPPCRDGERGGG